MSFYTHPTQPLTSVYHKLPLVGRQAAVAGAKSAPAKVLLFIPGNPGLIDYYTTYLELLQKRYPVLEILNVSHAGFQTTGDDFVQKGENSPFRFYDLQFQVNHKVEIITEFVEQKWAAQAKLDNHPPKIELFFLCHSVGAFITQRVLQRLLASDSAVAGKISVRFVGLICPTILDIKISSSGRIFTALFRWLPLIKVALALTRLLKWVLSVDRIKAIIRYQLSKKRRGSAAERDPDARANMANSIVATYNLVSSQRIIRQALTLAEEEMEEISQHDAINDYFFNTLTTPPQHNVKIWSFFADKDYWVHDNTRDSILSRYHDADNKNLFFQRGDAGGITHSFCVDQNKEFAMITIAALERFFDANLD